MSREWVDVHEDEGSSGDKSWKPLPRVKIDPETHDNYSNRVKVEEKASEKQVGGDHYVSLPIQPGEFIRKNNIGWYEGNAIKYVCRHRLKGGSQDIEKAIHYLQLALEEYKDGR